VIYVACTRVNELSNLFVAPIFPSVRQKVSRSEHDETQERGAVTEECREVLRGVGLKNGSINTGDMSEKVKNEFFG